MMKYQPQHIQKREMVDLQIIKCKYKSSSKKPLAIQFNQTNPQYISICYIWTELNQQNRPMESWFNWRAIQVSFFFVSWPFSYHPLGQATAIPLQQRIHTATHYTSLQHMSSDRTVSWKGILQYHCNNNFSLQRTTTHCNIRRATGQQKKATTIHQIQGHWRPYRVANTHRMLYLYR